jgi:uncharacterized protein YkwD
VRRILTRRPTRLHLAIVLAAVALPLAVACAPVKSGPSNDLYGRLDEIRAQNGLAPLAPCGPLIAAAQAHANDMSANGFLGHYGTDGSNWIARVNRNGYGSGNVGEVVAQGQTSVDQVMGTWMSSADHRNILLFPSDQHVGFAYANGNYWVGVVASGGTC